MPIDISQYRTLSLERGSIKTAGNTVHLSKSGKLVLGSNKFFGRLVSWFKGFRTQQHVNTRNHFVEALNDHYGRFITSQATTQGWVRQGSKKPLTMREIFRTFKVVDDLKADNEKNNHQLASRYAVPGEGDGAEAESMHHYDVVPGEGDEAEVQSMHHYDDVPREGDEAEVQSLHHYDAVPEEGGTEVQSMHHYDAVAEEDGAGAETMYRLEYKLSTTLEAMVPSGGSMDDARQVKEFIAIADAGRKIQSKILEKGDNGKFRVTEKEADNIAKQVFQDEAVQACKKLALNQHAIFKGSSAFPSQETIDYLNHRMEADLTAEIYKAGDENPKFPSRERVAEIAQNIRNELPKFVDAEKVVQSLHISDSELRTEVMKLIVDLLIDLHISDSELRTEFMFFVAKSGLSASQVKTAWEVGVRMQPHIETMTAANSTEEQLEKAINEYTNAVADLQSKDDIKALSGELREQLSTLMMMAQGGDWRATMDKMHHQITTPGALNSYIRATNHYRLSFPDSDAYKKQEAKQPDFYRSSLRRADTFSTWMESLGFASATMLAKSGGEAEIVDRSAPLESSSEIGDRTLNLMRNTGIKVPTPDRMGQSGGGTFSNEAVKSVEEELSDGKTGILQEDDISKQFLIDIGVRSPAYFNGVPAAKEEAQVIEQLKEFCTTNGELNKDMLFAVSQFHQGSVGAVLQVFKREQTAPVHGFFVGGDKDIHEYYFNKNSDGSVSVKIIFEKGEPKMFTPVYIDTSSKNPRYETMLDSDASEFRLDMEFLLTPDQFSAARDKFPPPKVANLSYRYGLYEDKE